MLNVEVGKRYERLLFFTAPISLAAIMLCLVAFASSQQQERLDASCYRAAAQQYKDELPRYEALWKNAQPIKEYSTALALYQVQLKLVYLDLDIFWRCEDSIDRKISEIYQNPPSKIIELLEQSAKKLPEKLRGKAMSIYGIELPADTTVDLFGTEVRAEIMTLTRVLQVVMLPVMLMWLGSLYSTRHREAMLIAKAESLAAVFPHLINIFVAADRWSPRKRNRLIPYLPTIWAGIYSVTRVVLLSIFILPPVVGYLGSLYFMAIQTQTAWPYLLAGIAVGMFTFTNVVSELSPVHAMKIFPDPRR
jgi:hypothetical protein